MEDMCFTLDFSTPAPSQFEKEEQEMERERKRQFLEEMQRIENPRTGPAIDNMLWKRHLPSEMPDTPILSVLKFEFKPEVELRDRTSAPRKVWDVVIRYILSGPGCSFVRWGTVVDSGASTVVCLIQWRNAGAWNEFQSSKGFHPITGFLASRVWNRCLKLDASDITGAHELQMVHISFKAHMDFDKRCIFDKNCNPKNYLGCLCSGWLEHNAVLFKQSTPKQRASAKTPTTFIFFFPADKLFEPSKIVQIGDLTEIQRDVSREVVKFLQTAPEHHAVRIPSRPFSPGGNIKWIYEINLLHNSRRVPDKLPQKGTFPGPRSKHYRQGELNQDNKLPPPSTLHSASYDSVLEVVWIKLYSLAYAEGTFEHAHCQLKLLEGYKAAVWAVDEDRESVMAILTMWHGHEVKASASEQYHCIVDGLIQLSPYVDRSWAIEYSSMPISYGPHHYACMEINEFVIPSDFLYEQVFTEALAKWEGSMVPYVQSGMPPRACYKEIAGGWRRDDADGGPLKYTSVVRWHSAAARADWYANLYSAPYSQFGLELDALKVGSSGGVQVRLLTLQDQLIRER